MGLAPQVLQQLLLLPQVVNMAVMLHQQLLQQLPPALGAAQLLLQLQVVARCWQHHLWCEDSKHDVRSTIWLQYSATADSREGHCN